jgi:peroxidase
MAMWVSLLPPPRLLLPLLVLLLPVVAAVHGGHGHSNLTVGFYRHSCPDAEAIVREVVAEAVEDDRTVTAPLLRLHFHDCFVRVKCFSSLVFVISIAANWHVIPWFTREIERDRKCR